MKRVDLDAYTRERFGLNLPDFLRQKTEKEALYDYEIARILGVSRGRIGHLRRSLGINRKNGFAGRFERKYGKGAVTRFTNMIENPENSLADAGNYFGFSREYARQVYREIQGYPYTMVYKKKREERRRQKTERSNEVQPMRVSHLKNGADMRRVSVQQSIEGMIKSKFGGVRGINCRFGINEANPLSREIHQIIWRRVAGNRAPVHQSESTNTAKTSALK